MLVSLRCPTCSAPVSFPAGARVTTCAYCRTEIRDVAPPSTPVGVDAPAARTTPSGAVLEETIAIRAPSGATIALLERGAALPATTEQTLSTSRDDQPSIRCELVVIGSTTASAAQLEIMVARAPRGVAKAPLFVRVDVEGNVHAAIRTEHATANASFSVKVTR